MAARRRLTRYDARELRTFKMALLTLREEAETFATPEELKLLLKLRAMIEHAIRSVNKELKALR